MIGRIVPFFYPKVFEQAGSANYIFMLPFHWFIDIEFFEANIFPRKSIDKHANTMLYLNQQNKTAHRSKKGKSMNTITYLRVSTKDQTIENQRNAIIKAGITTDKEFSDEGFTGTNINREGLKQCLNYVREGDILVVYSFSRIARTTRDLLDIIEELDKKGVAFKSITENIDTSTPTGKMMLTVISAMNEFEVQVMKERQKEGIERARREGKFKKQVVEKPANWDEVISKYNTRQITATKAMELLGLKKTTFYKLLKGGN